MVEAQSKINISGKLVNETFHSAKACQVVFTARDKLNLDASINTLLQVLTQSMQQSPLAMIACLNLENKKYGYFTNLIIKVAVATFVLAQQNRFNLAASQSLVRTNLLLLFGLTKPLLQIKNKPELYRKFRPHLRQAALVTFKSVKNAQIEDKDCLRLLTQLAGNNTFNKTNLTPQTVAIVALNGVINSYPFVNNNKLPAYQGFVQTHVQTSGLNTKPFVRSCADNVIRPASHLLLSGCIVRLKTKKYAMLLAQDHSTMENKWLMFEFADNKLNAQASLKRVDYDAILMVLPQQKVELTAVLPLFKHYGEQLNECAPAQLFLSGRDKQFCYHPNINVKTASKILQSEHNREICDFLQQEPKQASLILSYASGHNRQQQSVQTVNHAVALLGMARLYPVVANTDLQVCTEQSMFLGASNANEKNRQFASLSVGLSKLLNLDVPEYCQLTANILFLGLITIPKCRYAAASFTAVERVKTQQLHELLGCQQLPNWLKTTINLAVVWQLPSIYQSALKAYFELLQRKVSFNRLPRSTGRLVALLCLTNHAFISFAKGQHKVLKTDEISEALSVLGISPRDYAGYYQELIGNVRPQSPLY